jgi:putative RecB family exonuclease
MMYLPKHLSYSAVNQYEDCPRAWYLKYARKAEPRQTWFFPMGTVVHESVEAHLGGLEVPKFEDLFYPLIEKQMLIDPNHADWLSAGPFGDPVQGDKCVELGKKCVENAIKFLDDIDVHEVEWDASGMLPGCEVPIRGYVDVLGEHKKHGPVIVDWKSGKSKPKNNFQLETYAALLQPHDSQYVKGLWAMVHPDAAKARPIDLSQVSREELGARYQKAYEGMRKKVYAAHDAFRCTFCIMQDNCAVKSGDNERTRYYDDAASVGFPF